MIAFNEFDRWAIENANRTDPYSIVHVLRLTTTGYEVIAGYVPHKHDGSVVAIEPLINRQTYLV